ncbi:MAG: PadR family transcriptional regulator, partial [Candidatus Devosia euplotis]|nr:PadR family transcriptional regulator [Candidatus Devosia euplotis]
CPACGPRGTCACSGSIYIWGAVEKGGGGGFYSPSPGAVYPALTFLEETGYASSHADGNKKLYTITEQGHAHLGDNRESIESTLAFLAKAGEHIHCFREFARADWSAQRDGFTAPDALPGRCR